MVQRTVLALTILASTATLGTAVENAEARKACTNDANALCPDDVPDREKVYACLVKNINQLSPPCKKIISESIAPPQRRR
jgi:hypothetical protein